MKSLISSLIGFMLSVSVSAAPLIEGQVRLDSGEPVANAQVRIFDMSDLRQGAIARATTDATGYFALPLAALTGRALPQRFALGQNYPNPFNPSTIIPYQLTASSQVRLEVFNLLGQRIATLVDGERSAGFHTATWHATDGAGRAVGAGVYIYRMTVAAESQTGRMVLIDGQAGVAAGGAASVLPGASGGGGPTGASEEYGLIVSGSGLIPYADPAFRVEAGMAPVELVVQAGQYSAGKATDDDDALLDLFEFNDDDEGPGPSGKALATLAAPPPPPNLRVAAVTDSSCTVRWDAAEGVTDYDVNYKPAVGGKWTNEPHRGTRLYTTINDLEPNTEYRWAARAENSDGASAWVFGPNFTTLADETDETTEEEAADGQVTIPDANLRAAINEALGKASGATITVEEMATLTKLFLGWEYMLNLEGLQFATNLVSLDLS
ncbi:MAG: T9SS type A sorting domain-containing protein, partial [Gemmatimonadetes bacterium]|nr:T9SS type A sorting domain-containing protein [Gemmatimonadota bacterium]